MVFSDGTMEFIFTAGMLISFIGLIIGAYVERKNIVAALKHVGFKRRDVIIALLIMALFVAVELYLIKPTQLLFFDDAIYQGMALDLIHTGQAWMCNYGTPMQCFSGQVFHEPIGLSFNFAIAFLVLGVHASSAYAAELVLAAFSILILYPTTMLLLNDRRAAIFSSIILAFTPVVLVWAMPTNSDMATLAYSLLALFMLLVFTKKKTLIGLSNVFFSISLLLYMKVDALVYAPIFVLMFLLLADKSIIKTIKDAFKYLKKNILNYKFLIVVLVFIIVVYPSVFFAFSNYSSDGYGYQGANIQQSCSQTVQYITASGSINTANFKANLCANIDFWVNQFKNQDIMQPIYFTILAIIGIFAMAFSRKFKVLGAIAVWFVPIFLLYTAFYAGGVTYGVDWRFMLGLMAEAAILGGFALAFISHSADSLFARFISKKGTMLKAASYIVMIIMVGTLFYALYLAAPKLSINPSQIQQAGDARFYESFIYNSSHLIPSSCIIYTYDPTLFNINNRTATQMSNVYDSGFYNNASSKYSCSVLDVGYWCYTPNNLCTQAQHQFNLTPIAVATYNSTGNTYGLYTINK